MDKEYFLKRMIECRPEAFDFYNYDLLPETFLATDKIPITCLDHGIFYQETHTHLAGRGCPTCGKAIKKKSFTTKKFVDRSIAKFGTKFTYLETNYVKQNIDLIITCKTHGNFKLSPSQHFRLKYGCPKCNFEIPREIEKNKIFQKGKELHKNKYDYSKVIFVNMSDKVELICPIHGSFWQDLYGHTARGNGCNQCAISAGKFTLDKFIARSKIIHGDKYNYSKVKYETNASLVTITCKRHGDFIQRASSHLAGCKCKKCYNEESKLPTEKFIENAKLVHGDKFDYSKVIYTGNKNPVEIICPKHGSFWQTPNTHVSSRNGCRFCAESKGEVAVEIFLNKYGIKHTREYRISPHLYRYDFYLPEFDIYIEFHGQQHYRHVEFFGSLEEHLAVKKRDQIKISLVKQHGGKLIVLTYLNLSDGSVESELIRRLKSIYVRWYMVDDKLMVFKKLLDIYSFFNINPSVNIKDLDSEIQKTVKKFSVLF